MNNLPNRRSIWLSFLAGFLLGTSSAMAGGAGVGGFGAGTSANGSGTASGAGVSSSGGRVGASVGSGGGRSAGSFNGASYGSHSTLGNSGIGHSNLGGASTPVLGTGVHSFSNYAGGRVGIAPGNSPSQARGTLGAYRPVTSLPAQAITRPNNVWSDRGAGNGSSVRGNIPVNPQGLQNGAYPFDRAANGGSYTRLYPGSYGYGSRSYNDVGDGARGNGRGRYGDNHDGRGHYHNRNLYSSYPYYLGGGYYPFVGGYGYYGGLADSGYLNNDASLTPDLSTYEGGGQPTPQYHLDNPSGYDVPPGDSAQSEPAAKSQTPWADHQEPARPSSIGPDSMVEAVQDELAKRGYFKGKVDAMFRADTKDAIRQFQTDNNLQPTGLLNSATLTMLGLN